jgi:hypothetical protein
LGSYFLLVVLLMAIALPCLSAHPRAFVSSASNVSEFGQPYHFA